MGTRIGIIGVIAIALPVMGTVYYFSAQAMTQMEAEIHDKKQIIEDYQEQVSDLKETQVELVEAMTNAQSIAGKFEFQVKALEETNQLHLANIKSLNTELSQVRVQLTEVETEYRRLALRKDKYDALVDALHTIARDKGVSLHQFDDDPEIPPDPTVLLDRLINRLPPVKILDPDMIQDNQDLVLNNKVLEESNQKLLQELIKLRLTVKDLEEDNILLKESNATLTTRNGELTRENESLKVQMLNLNAQISSLKDRVEQEKIGTARFMVHDRTYLLRNDYAKRLPLRPNYKNLSQATWETVAMDQDEFRFERGKYKILTPQKHFGKNGNREVYIFEDEGRYTYLRIRNVEKFWENTRYLLIARLGH